MVKHRRHSSQSLTEWGWRADRKFIPTEHYEEDFDLDSNVYDDGSNLTNVPCPRIPCCPLHKKRPGHWGQIIVAVDGACKGNGGVNPCATIGVYFSRSSRWNHTEVLTDPVPTNQKAELTACLRALQIILQLKTGRMIPGENSNLDLVIIKADSEYIVKGMTDWIFRWSKNGFRTSKGTEVVNASLFKEVDEHVRQLNDHGVHVLFWHVPRARNREADALANAS